MTRRLLASSLLPLLTLGCYASTGSDAASIGASLELENGGLTMDDEAPAFGLDHDFESLALLAADPELSDPMEGDAALLSMSATPDAVRFRVAVVWGQIPGDPTNETPRNWSGALATNRGGMLVRRTIAFEPATDHLLPRAEPRAVAFTSATLPHFDGLVLDLVDPDPASADPMGLAYLPAAGEGDGVGVPLRALLEGPVELATDEAGNRMIAVAHATPVDPCAHGFVMGRWHRVEDGRGVIVGRVVDEGGALVGHLRGIYGVRASGERVFFAKYIGLDGTFRGVLRGHYADGRFEGRWLTRAGEVGAAAGGYRESIPGPETGGHFLGRWGELSCNLTM